MIKNKKQMILVIISFILVLVLGTVSYAFYNYTRTGSTNTVSVGRLNFTSTENNTINLSNVFPTDSTHLNSSNSSTVTINITGDTNYDKGIEYKVSLVDVNNVVNNKEVAMGFTTIATNLGTKSNDYYNDRGSTTNVYNLRESGVVEEGQDILIGYIKPDENGVNGSINITAYIDKDEVGISDTVSRIVNDNLVYGETDAEWIAGRTILTTEEWNSLATDGISFKVKVEANEGIWVKEEQQFIIDKLSSNSNWTGVRANITSVEFHTDGEAPANPINSFDVTDINGAGTVTVYILDDGLGNNTYKAIFVANDTIYAPDNSTGLFGNMPKLVEFNSENFSVENVTNMRAFFGNDSTLNNIQSIAHWDTKNVTNMRQIFYNCTALTNIDSLTHWNTSNVENMDQTFYNTHLTNVDSLVNWNTSNVQSMVSTFGKCSNLTNVNGLINWNTSNLTNMSSLFNGCSSLQNVDGLKNWNTSLVESMENLFNGCSSLQNVDGLKNWNTSNVTDMDFLFNNCSSLRNIDGLKNWKTSKVTSMAALFNNCGLQNVDGLIDWNTSSVIDMQNLISNSTNLQNVNGLINWDTSKVTNMAAMFNNCSNLQNVDGIENWNTSNVRNMGGMFNNCAKLTNVDLGSWNMSNVDNDETMFQASGVKTLVMPNNYTRIDSYMFNHAESYNGSSFTIPKTVTYIGNSHVFYNFGKDGIFNKFIVESGNTYFKTIDDILYSYDGTRLVSLPRGKTFTNRTYEIPEGITFMNELSFSRNKNIDTVILPNSYVIERFIDVGNNSYGFINSGSSLNVAIYQFTSVKRYEVKNDNTRYVSYEGCIYSKDGTELIAVPLHYTGVLNVKSGTTTFGQEAIWPNADINNIDGITQINIPASVTTIEANQLTRLNSLMRRSTNPVTITVDSGNTAYQIVNNQIVAR